LSLEKDIDRARLADEVLNNPVYAESYAQIEQEFTKLWRDSRDKDEREDIHRALLMLGKARTILEATMRSGQVAAKELERKRSLSERMTGGWRKTA
jgi:hypothetical protein